MDDFFATLLAGIAVPVVMGWILFLWFFSMLTGFDSSEAAVSS